MGSTEKQEMILFLVWIYYEYQSMSQGTILVGRNNNGEWGGG